MSEVSPILPGYGSITPYLVIPKCSEAIEFYTQVFGAEEFVRMGDKDGEVGHAEIRIGDSILMLSSGGPEWPATSGQFCLYVPDCDAVFDRAVAAGAEVIEPVSDKFYGDRAGSVRDPFGQRWTIMTHMEDLTPEEVEARMAALGG